MSLAKDYCFNLQQDACCFVMRNYVQVSQQTAELLELPPEELHAVAREDDINERSERVVWECVLRWIRHHRENRKGKNLELMKNVRLGQLNPEFVVENVKDRRYVAGNDEYCAIIMDALKSLHGLGMR